MVELKKVETLANRDVSVVADSRGAANWGSSIVKNIRGFAFWAELFSTSGIRFPYEYNFATGGYTSQQVADNLVPLAVASPASTFLYHAGINDLDVPYTLDQTIAITKASILALLNSGKFGLIVCDTPYAVGDTTKLAYHITYRDWVKDLCTLYPNQLAAIDVWPDWLDTSGALIASKTVDADDLHAGPDGNYDLGRRIATAFDRFFAPIDYLAAMAGGNWSALNPRGNLLLNGAMVGTGGTKSGVPAPTGNVATSFTLDSLGSTGATIAASKVTGSDGLGYQQIDIAGTPTTTNPAIQLRQSVTAANVQDGDILEGFAFVDVSASQTGLQGMRLSAFIADAGGSRTVMSGERDNAAPFPARAWSGVIRTPRFVVGASPSALSMSLSPLLIQNVAASVSVRVRGMRLRKVIAP